MHNKPEKIYDVIVIGAGSIGAPTAFSMAKAGLKVLVIERDPSVGQESSKRAIGGIRATHSDPAKISLCLRSIEIFSTWQQQYGEDIEWHKGGYSFVAYRDEEATTLQSLLITQKKLGLNINWHNAEELRNRLPDLNPKGLIGGTLSPDDGNASPLLATHAFFTQAIKQGAEFVFNEKVIEINQANGKVTGVKTEKKQYHSGIVINAAGAWATEVARLAGMEIPVRPDSHEAAITEPVAKFLDPMIVDLRPVTGSANYYFYQHSTGQIVFCITPSPSIWGFDTRETSSFLPMVAQRMIEVMPRLKNIRVRRTWRGLYPMTPDGFPIIGWSDSLKGLLLAAGMCGQGFMLGPGVAELLVRLVQNEPRPQDDEILKYVNPYREFAGQEKLK